MDAAILLCFLHVLLHAMADGCLDLGWYESNGNCNLFVNVKETWATAKGNCEQKQAHLVRNDNAAVDLFLRLAMALEGIDYIWTGANDIETEGVYVWVDNRATVTYTDWEKNNPNNYNDQDCVRFARNIAWNDLGCAKNYMFACQRTNQTYNDGTPSNQISVTTSVVQQTTTLGIALESTSSDEHKTPTANDAEQTTTPDLVEQTTISDPAEQTTTPDLVEQTTTSNPVEQTASTDHVEQTASTDHMEQTTTSDDMDQTSTSGYASSTMTPTTQCSCCTSNNVTQLTVETKQQIITELKKELFVVKANTSASRRKLISVKDSRASSAAIGVLGCLILTLILGCIIVPDMLNLGRFLFTVIQKKATHGKRQQLPTNL